MGAYLGGWAGRLLRDEGDGEGLSEGGDRWQAELGMQINELIN